MDIADVYEVFGYYHTNPEEMCRVEERHEQAITEAKQWSPLTSKDF